MATAASWRRQGPVRTPVQPHPCVPASLRPDSSKAVRSGMIGHGDRNARPDAAGADPWAVNEGSPFNPHAHPSRPAARVRLVSRNALAPEPPQDAQAKAQQYLNDSVDWAKVRTRQAAAAYDEGGWGCSGPPARARGLWGRAQTCCSVGSLRPRGCC